METNEETYYPTTVQSFGIVGIVILGMIVTYPVKHLNGFIGQEAANLIKYVVTFGFAFWVINYIRRKGRRTGHQQYSLKIPHVATIPLVMIGALALEYGISPPLDSVIPYPEFVKDFLWGIKNSKGFFTFLGLVVAAPVLEELIFRGIMLDGLLKNYSPLKSILLSGILFGFMHLNPWQLVGSIIFGCFVGWVYFRTRSLSLCIIIHATVNLGAYLLRFINWDRSALDETLFQSYGGMLNLVLAVAGGILIFACCVYFLNKLFAKTEAVHRTEAVPVS